MAGASNIIIRAKYRDGNKKSKYVFLYLIFGPYVLIFME